MALPLILGLLGSTLGAGATSGVLATLGSVGAGALGSGLGRFIETGDLEEGLKTGAVSFLGGSALKGALGGMGGQVAEKASGQAFQPTYGASLTAEGLGQAGAKTFGSQLMNIAQNPIAQGQAILAQGSVPLPPPKKAEDIEFENRQAGIPRNVDRKPPPDYRPGIDPEFDYGITPNFGVGVMSPDNPRYMAMGGLVGLLGDKKVQNLLGNMADTGKGFGLAALMDTPQARAEANFMRTGEYSPEMQGMQEGGMAEVMSPDVEDSPELKQIIIRAARALQGATEEPEKDINRFVERFGMQALNDLRQRVASGELNFGEDGGVRGMVRGEGDGMSDSIEAEIVEEVGEPSGSGRPLQVANNEYVVAADVVSDIGNGSSEAGAEKLDRLMKEVRLARHGTTKQPDEKNMMEVMKQAIS